MNAPLETLCAAAERIGAGAALRRIGTWRGVVALTYHRIGRDAPGSGVGMRCEASPDEFEAQMRFLARHFDVIAIDEFKPAMRARRGRHVLITLDDGYRDVHEHAFPVLRRVGLPATLFLTTGFPDSDAVAWWDELAWMAFQSPLQTIEAADWLPAPVPLPAGDRRPALNALRARYRRLRGDETRAFLDAIGVACATGRHPGGFANPWMSWEMVREMARSGIAIGGHSVTHPLLSRLSRERQQDEVRGCRQALAARLGGSMRWFAYPVGLPDSFDEVTRSVLREEGVELAFSCHGGHNPRGRWDPYDVRRIPGTPGASAARFRASLTVPQAHSSW